MSLVPAMILCAGHGTRLRPLTDELPKPLVPLGDRPVLAHVVERLTRSGVGPLAVNTHHKSDEFTNVINGFGVDVQVFYEPGIRGTAGGIAGARSVLAPGPCLVHNGDIVVDAPVERLVAEVGHGGLVLAVARRPVGEGSVGVDARGNVVRLRGRSFGSEAQGGDYVGVAALGADALADLPERGCLIGDYALPALERGAPVSVVPVSGPWSDVGTLGSYLSENIEWLARTVGVGAAWVGPGAIVDPGVSLASTVVGAAARVVGRGVLERCVIWPGARVEAPLANAVVTRAGAVVPVAP